MLLNRRRALTTQPLHWLSPVQRQRSPAPQDEPPPMQLSTSTRWTALARNHFVAPAFRR